MTSDLLVALGYLSMFAFPLLVSMVDFVPAYRADATDAVRPKPGDPTCDDFEVLVPIYGNVKYFENIDFLSPYGDRVVLTTTDQESDQFYSDLEQIAADHDFRIVRACTPPTAQSSARSTTGTIRDRIVAEAVQSVTRKYVICLDADSFPDLPFELLVGAMDTNGFQTVSTTLIPANLGRVLGRLQLIEYTLAMRLRRIMPWLVSGGCHAATTPAYQAVMQRHSLFFQGNDVEVGLLSEMLGFQSGHVDYVVRTEVPDTPKSWYRQRYAWAGGEWRLAVANIKLFAIHPLFFCYTTIIMIGMFPIRWYSVLTKPEILWVVYVIYAILISVLMRKKWTPTVLLYPFYAFFNSLILTPLGGISYVQMSIVHKNWGQIGLKPRKPL